MMAISDESITAEFGVNFRVPENSGKILTLDALMAMGFFYSNASAWYINLGRNLPENKCIYDCEEDNFYYKNAA